jgi:predicted porin
LDFDTTNSPAAQDNQSTTLNFESSVSFLQRNFLSHSFSLNYLQEPSNATTANPGASGDAIPANFQERTTFAYNLNYPLNERLNVRLSYQINQIKESDGGNQFKNETISFGLPFQLNTRTLISARYTYSKVSGSEFTEFNHDQNLVEITFRLNL